MNDFEDFVLCAVCGTIAVIVGWAVLRLSIVAVGWILSREAIVWGWLAGLLL